MGNDPGGMTPGDCTNPAKCNAQNLETKDNINNISRVGLVGRCPLEQEHITVSKQQENEQCAIASSVHVVNKGIN